jgi:multicomponent Na+:H+ antiporter subunit C
VVYLLCLMLFAIGIFGVLTQRNLIKIIISLAVIESSINIFLILLGYREGGETAIVTNGTELLKRTAVDPLPQAMVLTIIAIGVSVLIVSIVIAMRLYHRYGTYDVSEINKLRG